MDSSSEAVVPGGDLAERGSLRQKMDVAIIGGTGEEGFGLTLRLGKAGHHVVIGSRSEDKGASSAESARGILGGSAAIEGTTNEAAAARGEVVIVTVPYEGQAGTYRAIKAHLRSGTIVCDATSPLATAVGGKAWHVIRPWHGSAAEQAAAILGAGIRMTAGFHTVSADALRAIEVPMDSDVLVCGDDAEAKSVVGGLIEDVPGMRWVDCGLLSQARIAESMTALLISVNRQYAIHDSGFRITGRDGWGRPVR
jgi:8-hydroxy-5-deazaflavin:NADPH oxidoreductase